MIDGLLCMKQLELDRLSVSILRKEKKKLNKRFKAPWFSSRQHVNSTKAR